MRNFLPRLNLPLIAACAALLCVSLPGTALASYDIDACASDPHYGASTPTADNVTQKIVACLTGMIQYNAIDGPDSLLNTLSGDVTWVVGGLSTLVIAILGMRILGGEDRMVKTAASFILRFAATIYCLRNMGTIADAVLQTESELVNLVSTINHVSLNPWQRYDWYIRELLGLGSAEGWGTQPAGASGTALKQGIVGLIGGAAMTSSTGIFMAFAGIAAILELIFLMLRSIYIYVSAFAVMALMLGIAPLIVPLALFTSQERYVKMWSSIIVAAMMIPPLLFALVNLFMQAFEQVANGGTQGMVQLIYALLGSSYNKTGLDGSTCTDGPAECANFDPLMKGDTPQYQWTMQADPTLMKQLQGTQHDTASAAASATMPGNINPRLAHSVGYSMRTPTLDFGTDPIYFVVSLVMCFFELWVLVSLLKSLIQQIPSICYDITGAAVAIDTGATELETRVKGFMSAKNPAGLSDISNSLSERLRPGTQRLASSSRAAAAMGSLAARPRQSATPLAASVSGRPVATSSGFSHTLSHPLSGIGKKAVITGAAIGLPAAAVYVAANSPFGGAAGSHGHGADGHPDAGTHTTPGGVHAGLAAGAYVGGGSGVHGSGAHSGTPAGQKFAAGGLLGAAPVAKMKLPEIANMKVGEAPGGVHGGGGSGVHGSGAHGAGAATAHMAAGTHSAPNIGRLPDIAAHGHAATHGAPASTFIHDTAAGGVHSTAAATAHGAPAGQKFAAGGLLAGAPVAKMKLPGIAVGKHNMAHLPKDAQGRPIKEAGGTVKRSDTIAAGAALGGIAHSHQAAGSTHAAAPATHTPSALSNRITNLRDRVSQRLALAAISLRQPPAFNTPLIRRARLALSNRLAIAAYNVNPHTVGHRQSADGKAIDAATGSLQHIARGDHIANASATAAAKKPAVRGSHGYRAPASKKPIAGAAMAINEASGLAHGVHHGGEHHKPAAEHHKHAPNAFAGKTAPRFDASGNLIKHDIAKHKGPDIKDAAKLDIAKNALHAHDASGGLMGTKIDPRTGNVKLHDIAKHKGPDVAKNAMHAHDASGGLMAPKLDKHGNVIQHDIAKANHPNFKHLEKLDVAKNKMFAHDASGGVMSMSVDPLTGHIKLFDIAKHKHADFKHIEEVAAANTARFAHDASGGLMAVTVDPVTGNVKMFDISKHKHADFKHMDEVAAANSARFAHDASGGMMAIAVDPKTGGLALFDISKHKHADFKHMDEVAASNSSRFSHDASGGMMALVVDPATGNLKAFDIAKHKHADFRHMDEVAAANSARFAHDASGGNMTLAVDPATGNIKMFDISSAKLPDIAKMATHNAFEGLIGTAVDATTGAAKLPDIAAMNLPDIAKNAMFANDVSGGLMGTQIDPLTGNVKVADLKHMEALDINKNAMFANDVSGGLMGPQIDPLTGNVKTPDFKHVDEMTASNNARFGNDVTKVKGIAVEDLAKGLKPKLPGTDETGNT